MARLNPQYFRAWVGQLRATLDTQHGGTGTGDEFIRLFHTPKGREGFEPERALPEQVIGLPSEQDLPLGMWRVYGVQVEPDGTETMLPGTEHECEVYDQREAQRGGSSPDRAAVRAAADAIELQAAVSRRAADNEQKEYQRRLAAEAQVAELCRQNATQLVTIADLESQLDAAKQANSGLEAFWQACGPSLPRILQQVGRQMGIDVPDIGGGGGDEVVDVQGEESTDPRFISAIEALVDALRRNRSLRKRLPRHLEPHVRYLCGDDDVPPGAPPAPDPDPGPQPPPPDGGAA